MKEVDGHLWHIRYPLTADSKVKDITHIEVATTRPETLLGDVAVAVNPLDDRYRSVVGKKLIVPFLGRQIPIIADQHVDMSFGTGCVKVTPAHDENDFAIGQRHQLPQINVMNKDGSMNSNAGPFQGLDRFNARKKIVEALEDEGLLVKVESHRHNVPFSERGKVPVEPILSTQWFVRMEPIAASCREALGKNKPQFVPDRWTKVYRDWLTDIRDWCISRQLWWGHRIPAWYVISETDGRITQETPYIVARSSQDAYEIAKRKYGDSVKIEQDSDVLDTWFSSGLWPFSTLGWPETSSMDLERWYPTNTLVTGFDIIFFWVARMTMMANIFTEKIPFSDVYIHGLVRDEQNRKMSKSAGNGIDPILLINRYGADALRFALVREVAGAGQDIRLDYDRKKDTSVTVEAARNFANKIWNVTRFALINLGPDRQQYFSNIDLSSLQLSDRWVLSRLHCVNLATAKRYNSYSLGEAAKGLYEFAWHDVCDWYVELIKRRLNPKEDCSKAVISDQFIARQVLIKVLCDLMIMLHPLMPHLTEELWHELTGANLETFLALESWPRLEEKHFDKRLEDSFVNLIDVIRVVRNLRAVAGLKPMQRVPVCFITERKDVADFLEISKADIMALTNTNDVQIFDKEDSLSASNQRVLAGISGDLQIILLIDGLVDFEDLFSRLKKDLSHAEKNIQILSSRLANKSFVEKAPSDVVSECKKNLLDAQAQAELASKRINDLS